LPEGEHNDVAANIRLDRSDLLVYRINFLRESRDSEVAAGPRLFAIDNEAIFSRKQGLRFDFRLVPIDGEGYVSIPTQ
jgi:hypothetical protein